MIEMVVSLFLLLALTAALMSATRFFGHANRQQLARQQCIAAAQAQLDAIAFGGSPLSEQDMKQLWPAVTCMVDKTPGLDVWQKLDLYTVNAKAVVHGREISIQAKRYIRRQE
ncbi:MAG: hypothetical protein ABFD91_10630 [Anaerohalosphaeraceae bacterium]